MYPFQTQKMVRRKKFNNIGKLYRNEGRIGQLGLLSTTRKMWRVGAKDVKIKRL